MPPAHTIVLRRSDVAGLLSVDECILAVERMFRTYGAGGSAPPGILGIRSAEGGFHIKAGLYGDGRTYCAAKINANFPGNGQRFGLPTIQGVIVLFDGENGHALAILDSIEITIQRTGAATAIAAKYLARDDAAVVTLCGCGEQGRSQLRSLLKVRELKKAYVYDTDHRKARLLADEFSPILSIEPITAEDLPASVERSRICVTCTTSRRHFLNRDNVVPGTFVAGVGADSEEKQELDPRLFLSAKVVTDITAQCAAIGDLHHALAQGLIGVSGVYAELGEIVAGRKPGRTTDDEITLFDSTGMALQDAAAAVFVYRKAVELGAGERITFNE